MPNLEFNGLYNNDFSEKQVGEQSMHETERAIAEIPEIPAELQNTYEDFDNNKTYYVFCGDDRPLTKGSVHNLARHEVVNASNAIRVFGGAIGSARAIAVMSLASDNESIKASVRAYKSNFNSYIIDTARVVKSASNLVPGVHSAQSNEGNDIYFDSNRKDKPGCAYAANAEAVTSLNTEPQVIEFAKKVIELLGSSPQYIDRIIDANKRMQKIFSDDNMGSFNLSRKDIASLALPTAIVTGNHASVAEARAIINLKIDKVSNPQKALSLEMPSYNHDVTIECASILKSYPNLDFNPRMLLEAKILDICATAEALASSESKHAWDFNFERIGNFEDAVSTLEELKNQL